ncbi:MAG TPA: hypothetical protein VGL86_15220 [Polyangia bacterium]|jgi:hypothetical protein
MCRRAAVVALLLAARAAAADVAAPSGAKACVASLTAARDFAARLDSALEKVMVRAEKKRVVVYGGECNRVQIDVHADERGRTNRAWRKSGKRVQLLLEAGANTCGEERAEERAHGGFVASLITRAVPAAIVDRFKRAVDECLSAGAGPKSARRLDRRAAPP